MVVARFFLLLFLSAWAFALGTCTIGSGLNAIDELTTPQPEFREDWGQGPETRWSDTSKWLSAAMLSLFFLGVVWFLAINRVWGTPEASGGGLYMKGVLWRIAGLMVPGILTCGYNIATIALGP